MTTGPIIIDDPIPTDDDDPNRPASSAERRASLDWFEALEIPPGKPVLVVARPPNEGEAA